MKNKILLRVLSLILIITMLSSFFCLPSLAVDIEEEPLSEIPDED